MPRPGPDKKHRMSIRCENGDKSMLISKLNACFCPHFPAVLNYYIYYNDGRRKKSSTFEKNIVYCFWRTPPEEEHAMNLSILLYSAKRMKEATRAFSLTWNVATQKGIR